MDAETIKTIFDYHYGMFDSVWACAAQLTTAEFIEDNGYSLGSVRNHLVHCMNVDDRWLARLQEATPPDVLDEAAYPGPGIHTHGVGSSSRDGCWLM